nr:hypothetical protein [Nostoc sp. ChiSLP03a]
MNQILNFRSRFSIKLVCLALHFLPSPKIKLLVALWFVFKTRKVEVIEGACDACGGLCLRTPCEEQPLKTQTAKAVPKNISFIGYRNFGSLLIASKISAKITIPEKFFITP